MVPRTDAFMVDIQDDTKEIIESILKPVSYTHLDVYKRQIVFKDR